MRFDEESQYIFHGLKTGKLSRQEFVQAYNALFTRIPENSRKNLERRLDRTKNYKGRSLGEFALSIFDASHREASLMSEWSTMCLESGLFESIYIENFGVDNSGLLLLEVNNSKADYIVHCKGGENILPDGSHKLEVKFCPTFKKLTYKVDNLKSYLNNSTYVLTIVSDGQIGGNGDLERSDEISFDFGKMRWVIFSPPLIQRMLDEIEHKNYWEVGGKKAIQLLEKDFPNYFTVFRWHAELATA